MKTDKNSYGFRQDIAEALAAGVVERTTGPWEEMCKKFPNEDPDEEIPCMYCRGAINMIATWDTIQPAPEGDPVNKLKDMLGDLYEPFMRTYAAAYTRLLHSFSVPAVAGVAKKPPKKTAKRPPVDDLDTIELPERIRKTKDPAMVKVPLIDGTVPKEDVVLSPIEKKVIDLVGNLLAVGTPVEKVYAPIATTIEGMDNRRMLITLAYLPEASANKLLDHIETLHKEAMTIPERMEEFSAEFGEIAKKIPRSQIQELAERDWDVVTYVFAPIGVGIILSRPAMITNAMFEEFLMLFDGVAFPELMSIVCKLFVSTHGEKPEKIVNLSQHFLTVLTKMKESDAVRKPLYDECQKIVDRELGAIPEALEIAKYLERALIDEET